MQFRTGRTKLTFSTRFVALSITRCKENCQFAMCLDSELGVNFTIVANRQFALLSINRDLAILVRSTYDSCLIETEI